MERVSCPFDPVHTIEPRRLQAHIIKCKRNLPANHDFVECKYYHLHYFRKGQMEAHYATCEHKLGKEAYQRMWETEFANVAAAAPPTQESIPDWHFSGETWDAWTGTSFQYDQHKERANHMTVPEGLSKAKRREFKEKERERLRELEDKTHKPVNTRQAAPSNALEEFGPVPRKPGIPAVHGSCRIAAKFPSDLDTVTEQGASGAVTSYAGNVIKGKGRTVPERTEVKEVEVGYQFSKEQFPDLKF